MNNSFSEYYNDYKLFIDRTGLLIITNILLTISSIVLMPFVANNYSVNDLGIWAQLYTSASLVSTLSTMGLTYSMTRFLASKTTKKDIQEGFNSIMFTIVFILLIIAIILVIFANSVANILFEGNTVISMLLIPLIIFGCLNIILFNYFRTFNRIKLYSIVMVAETYIHVILVAYLSSNGYNLATAITGVVVSYLIATLTMLYIISRDINFKIPQFKNLKDYLKFGIPTIPNDLAFWAIDSGDRYVIQFLIGITAVGYYSPGYMLGNYLLMVSGPLTILLAPILSKNFDDGKISEVKSILQYSSKYLLLVGIPFVFILSTFSKQILLIIANPEAIQSYLVVPFIAISALLYGIYIIASQVLLLHKRTKIIAYFWFSLVALNLGLNYLLLPKIGIIAAAIVNLITFIALTSLTMIYSFKFIKFNFKIDLKDVLKMITASILISIPLAFISPNSTPMILGFIVIDLILYITILRFMGVFKDDEKELFKFFVNDSVKWIYKKLISVNN